jgi:RHS repeat-associated protein
MSPIRAADPYDLMGRKLSQADVDAGTTTYGYDNGGLLTSVTDALGKTLVYSYDALGRKTAEYQGSLTGPMLASWAYDTVQPGKLSSSTRYTSTGNYLVGYTGYDGAGNPTGVTVRVPAGEVGLGGDYHSSMSYTSTGLQDVTEPAAGGSLPAEQVVTTYDQLGNAKSVTGYNTYADKAEYTTFGELHKFTTVGNSQLAIERDDQTRRVTDVRLSAAKAPPQIDDTSYTYDPAGNLTSSTDVQGPAGSPTQRQCFAYDALDRLAQAWTAGDCSAQPTSAAISGVTPYWTSWTFGPAGLRKTQVQHALAGATADTTTTYTYPAPNTPQAHTLSSTTTSGPSGTSNTGYTYDAVGNTRTRTLPTGQQTLTWNEDGRLATDQTDTGTTSYVYDADGNVLIRRDPGSSTLYLPGEELKYSTSLKNVVGTRYYGISGNAVAMRVGGGNPTVLSGDQHGTNSLAYQPDTDAITRRSFDPYGNQFGTPLRVWPDDHGFLNKSVDQATGLTDVGAREYDATIGRFLSVDPELDPTSPGQLNGYAYSADNPTTFSDPTGARIAGCEEDRLNCRTGEQLPPTTPAQDPKKPVVVFNTPHVVAIHDPVTGRNFINHVEMPKDMDFSSAVTLLAMMMGDPDQKTWWPIRSGFDDPLAGDDETVQMLQHVCGFDNCGKGVGKELFDMHMTLALPVLVAAGGLSAGSMEMAGMERSRILPNGQMYDPMGRAARLTDMPDRVRQTLSCATGNSFAAGTLVMMADGSTKPIEDVKVGDTAENADVDSDVRQQHAVTAVHVTDDDTDFVDLAVGSGSDSGAGSKTITVTAHHLFWDATTHQWIYAADLAVGDQLDTPGDGHVPVVSTHRYTKSIRTYNLTVDTVHAYYVLVGGVPVLVHNVDECDIVAQTLGSNLPSEGVSAARGDRVGPDEQRMVNESGDRNGCSTCAASVSGYKDGHWTGDHQPPNKLAPNGPWTLFPQCKDCARQQGGIVNGLNREWYRF